MIEINPTCVPDRPETITACAERIKNFASRMQIDVDDGKFTPHITWPYSSSGELNEFVLPNVSPLKLEIHLMVAKPQEIGIEFARAGVERVIAHVEAFDSAEDVHRTLDALRRNGATQVGLAVLMETPLELIEHHKYIVDFVLLMSIATIGIQGIPYDVHAPARIAEFHGRYPDIPIAVDGGVSESNIADLVKAGATRFGVGSAIMKSTDPSTAYERLMKIAENALQ